MQRSLECEKRPRQYMTEYVVILSKAERVKYWATVPDHLKEMTHDHCKLWERRNERPASP